MKAYSLEEVNEEVSKLSVEQIAGLSDDRILKLAMSRPGHPKQKGFMLNIDYFESNEHMSKTLSALMNRLTRLDGANRKE